MLKKAMFLCLMACVVVFAENKYALYNESGKLYVSIGNNMISFSEQFEQLLEKRGVNGLANSKNWLCYLGSTEIMEYEFFEAAGYNDKADVARSHMQFKKVLDFVGPGIALSSCLVSLIGVVVIAVEAATNEDLNPTTIYVGLGGIGVGISLGVVRFMKRGKKYTASIAVEAANKYNKSQTK